MPSTEDQQHIDGDIPDANEIHSSFTDNLDFQNTVDKIQSGFQQIISEGVSQNSGALNEFTDTGQVLLTIVDTAGAELKSTAELTKSQSDVSYSDQHENINQSHSSASLPSHSVPLIPIKHSTSNLSDNNNDNFDEPDDTFRNISLDENNNIVDLPEVIDQTTTIVPSEEIEPSDVSAENDSIKLDELLSSSEVAKEDSIVVSTTPKAQDLEVKDKEDIPSFAEWAQKQLEEAEKKKEIQNISFQQNQQNQRNNGRHSTSNIKLRSKNYASPDCGAKIVAANAEATSPSLILSPSKDEYMLNTCNSRIWFVVELCEAVQAKRVELANFELFSSTPKDFSVYISDRYPTRDWNSIGQFVAKDERDIQMYDLQPPYIFGKYVKVELNSHYGSEHYCPISLFRLYGTSEYEVLETEDFHHNQHNIHHHTHDSDDEDEFIEEELIKGDEGETSYLFGSAREVVMSFVKKAAQVLVMTSDSTTNRTTQRTVDCNLSKLPIITEKCQTPSHLIVCDNCSDLFFGNVYSLLSCRNNYLKYMSETYLILNALTRTDICSMYGLNFNSKETSCYPRRSSKMVSAFFGPEYIAALCNILAIREKKVVLNTSNSLLNNVIDDTFDNYSTTTETQQFNVVPNERQVSETDQQIILNESLSEGGLTTETNPQLSSNEETDKILTENVDTVTKPEIESSESIWTTPSETDSYQTLETDASSSIITEIHHTETPPISATKTIVDEVPPTVQQNEEQQQRIAADTPSNGGENYEIVQEIDSFLSEWDQYPPNNNPVTTTPITPPSSMPQQGQKESVFVRLVNRIKALERNMSLSSQYLEELSRRYKKQMEEMQRSFDQVLTIVKEESKKSEDFYEQCTDTQARMNSQLTTLTNTVEILMAERNSWTNVVSWFMHFFITQLFIITIVLYFCGKSDTRKYSTDSSNSDEQQKTNEIAIPKRRKSVDVVRHESPAKRRKRRPSEEALNITGTYNDLLIPDITEVDSKPWQLSKADKRRKRKKNAILRRSNSNSTLVSTKIKQHHHRNVINTHSYDFVTTKQNFNIQNSSVNNIDDFETISIESVSSSSDRTTPPRRQENLFDRENVLAKLINPIVMKSAVTERKKRYSLQDNSTIEAATLPPRKDPPKQQKTHANHITNEKNLVLTNGSGNVPTRSNSVTSSSGNLVTPKKEKKTGGLKKILKKVF
ncbi:SUN domain-containing ossification factor [Chrysoperla carnea]|uniref:SUN domain-containing ossification factor n=1 Tax=Chrysoperla carnea TaxID=189513 RepID=UPI001D05FC77|nr:SUN domain-containing ossification factor [Chrysoperla carnea]